MSGSRPLNELGTARRELSSAAERPPDGEAGQLPVRGDRILRKGGAQGTVLRPAERRVAPSE
jgi:hypothetical protein